VILHLCWIFLFIGCTQQDSKPSPYPHPNVIYILADDLGYGDVSCLNSESKIETPNLDRLAEQGMIFTDAHAPGSVCTPTRYGVLTGTYCWRSRLPRGVMRGYGPSLIREETITLADVFKRNGYTTGCVGIWHLGVNWVTLLGDRPGERWEGPYTGEMELHEDSVDYSRGITGGPMSAGFDYHFILPASLDMKPYCYIENGQLTSLPTDYTAGNDLNTGYMNAFWRPGKIAPDFEFEGVLPTFIDKAIQFIKDQSAQPKPFFLYLPLAAPHTPWVPTQNYEGASEAGMYGDFVSMVDACVGQLLEELEATSEAENTMVVFTSDNGPFWRPAMVDSFQHQAAYIYKGMKADIWEGGHRVPFIVKWPGHVPAGSERQDLMSLTDFLATAAAMLGDSLNAKEGIDSQNMYPAFTDSDVEEPLRVSMIMQSSSGLKAVRKGEWKYIPELGSGGFSEPRTIEPQPGEAEGQLYNLKDDPSETQNVYLEYPDIVQELSSIINQ